MRFRRKDETASLGECEHVVFFHIVNANWKNRDEEGMEFTGPEAAMHEARMSAQDIIQQRLGTVSPLENVRIEVEDQVGTLVGVMPVHLLAH